MKTFLKTFFLIALLTILFTGCDNTAKPSAKKTVVVSVAPYKYFVDKIVLGKIETFVLVPNYANPHIYEPQPRLLEQARAARLWFTIGENFEAKIAKALPIKIVDLQKNVPLIKDSCCHHHHHAHSVDVHMWLSPKMALLQSLMIKKALIEAFPEYANEFESAFIDLKKELLDLDKEISIEVQNAPSKDLLVSHPAFGYLCRDYGLLQHSIEQEGKEPSLKQLVKLSKEAKEKKISFILIQAQHDNKGAIRLSEELKVPAVLIDPYSPDYTNNMRKMIRIIGAQGKE